MFNGQRPKSVSRLTECLLQCRYFHTPALPITMSTPYLTCSTHHHVDTLPHLPYPSPCRHPTSPALPITMSTSSCTRPTHHNVDTLMHPPCSAQRQRLHATVMLSYHDVDGVDTLSHRLPRPPCYRTLTHLPCPPLDRHPHSPAPPPCYRTFTYLPCRHPHLLTKSTTLQLVYLESALAKVLTNLAQGQAVVLTN